VNRISYLVSRKYSMNHVIASASEAISVFGIATSLSLLAMTDRGFRGQSPPDYLELCFGFPSSSFELYFELTMNNEL